MAEAAVDSNMDCLLCAGDCVQPVTLGCEHRFCCRCLREHWAPSDSGDCPVCKRRSSKYLPPDFALEKRDLSERQTESSGEKEKEEELPKQPAESVTDEPGESQGAATGGEQQFDVKLKPKKESTEEISWRSSKGLPHNFASEKRDINQSSAESSEEMEEDINICHLYQPSALQESTTCAQTSQMSPRIPLKRFWLDSNQKPVTPAKKPPLQRLSDPSPTSGTKETFPKVSRRTRSLP